MDQFVVRKELVLCLIFPLFFWPELVPGCLRIVSWFSYYENCTFNSMCSSFPRFSHSNWIPKAGCSVKGARTISSFLCVISTTTSLLLFHRPDPFPQSQHPYFDIYCSKKQFCHQEAGCPKDYSKKIHPRVGIFFNFTLLYFIYFQGCNQF